MTLSPTEAAGYRTGAGTAERTRWLAGAFGKRLRAGDRVIELGAGGLAGHLSAVCVEAEPALLAVAIGPTVRGAPERLPMRSGALDAVVATTARLLS